MIRKNKMVSYEHKVKNIYLWSPYEEWTPIIPGDYTLLRWPCDEGFHVPLQEERQAIIDAGVTANQFKVNLHISFSGRRYHEDGTWGISGAYLWSSSPYSDSARYLYIDNSSIINSRYSRALGLSIRAFRNTPIIPDENRTETVTWKVWYNSDLWLISILVWTNQYVTMQDKNVWATTVWNDWDTLTNDNRWKYFQRWNNYGFTWNSSGDTSTTLVDASGYWPNNPYSSSTFITQSRSPYDRSTTKNDNLRWYTDFNS